MCNKHLKTFSKSLSNTGKLKNFLENIYLKNNSVLENQKVETNREIQKNH